MKRLFTIGVVVVTIVWAVGLAGVVAMPVKAAAAGDLIKMAGNPAVYYLGADSKRYCFPNYNTYKTWYKDFSTVKTISQSELQSYDLGGNVTYRAGTRLIKITTVPKVYAVEPGGVLRWVTSETVASNLYGSLWTKKIDDVPDPFWVNYSATGADVAATYPTGTLVKEGTNIYYIDSGSKRLIADMTAFNANNFNLDYVLTVASLTGYTAGTSITAAEDALIKVAGGATIPATTSTGTLTATLASDTPAAGTLVKNATYAKFTKVNFTASGGDVVIDAMTIIRGGLAQDSNISNVYLLDSSDTMLGNEKTLGSVHTAVVNDDITVKNGETKSYTIAATMYSTLQSGEVVTLGISAITLKGSATLSASLPIVGNGMTMNNTITVGTVIQTAGSTNPSTGSTSKQVGTTDYVFAATKLAINATENVQIERIRFYQSGTAADGDIANLDLVVDGVVLATIAKPVNKAAVFDLSATPYTITKGQDKTFEIRGDIVDGSSRTIEFEFDKKTDIKAKGKTYGFYITPVYVTSTTSSPYWNNTSYVTISTGTLVVSKKILSSVYVAEGATQVVLGAFSFRANGEPIIITAIHIELTTTTAGNIGGLTNVTVYDEGGSVVAGPVDPTELDEGTGTAVFTDTFTVPTGEHFYYVKGDLDSNWSAGDTIIASVEMPSTSATAADEITAKGEITNNTVYPTPYSEVFADTMTVRAGALNVSTLNTPVAQTIVAGSTGVTFANFVLDASGSGEDVKVTQLSIRHSTTVEGGIHDNISNIKVYKGSTVLNLSDVESGTTGTTATNATTTIDLDTALIIPKGTSVTLVLKGDISGSAATDSGHEFSMVGTSALVAYGNSTGVSITETITNSDGQTMTVAGNAKLTIGPSSASASSDGLLPANTDGLTVGIINFRAQYQDINLEEVYLKITAQHSGGPDQFDKVYLYNGTTKVAEAQATTTDATVGTYTQIHLDLSENPVLIAAGTSKDLTVKVDTSDTDYYNLLANSKGWSSQGFNFSVNAVGDVVARANGLLASTAKTLNATTLKNYYLYKSVPTIKTNLLASGTLLAGTATRDVFQFSVTADPAGDVALAKVSFFITTSTATATNWYLYESGTQVAATTTMATSTPDGLGTEINTGGTAILTMMFTSDGTAPDTDASDCKAQVISAGTTKTYTLRADLEGPSSTNTGSVQIQFMGDSSVLGTYPGGYGPGAATNLSSAALRLFETSLIWGDLWRTGSLASTTASSTEQWTNGYLVPSGATTKLEATSSATTFSK